MSRRLPADLAMLNAATMGLRAHAWRQDDPDVRAWLEGVAAVADRVIRRYSRQTRIIIPHPGGVGHMAVSASPSGRWQGYTFHASVLGARKFVAQCRRRERRSE